MKKYIVTKKHKFLKKGIIISPDSYRCIYYLYIDEIIIWRQMGWIEEIKKPSHTRIEELVEITKSIPATEENVNMIYDLFKKNYELKTTQ